MQSIDRLLKHTCTHIRTFTQVVVEDEDDGMDEDEREAKRLR
jgi:hypothetical protein